MLAAITGAEESIDFESYILATDRTGALFRGALIDAARRGVRVRLLYDAVGSWSIDEEFRRPMLEAGIEVAVYHPMWLTRPLWLLNRRDHRKIMIVDRKVSFTGGVNVSDDNLPAAAHSGWRDTHVEIAGAAAAARFATLFQLGWRRAHHFPRDGGQPRRLPFIERQRAGRDARRERRRPTPQPPVQGVLVRILGNRTVRNRHRIRRAYLRALDQAERYALIENAYFIPSRAVLWALARAVRRGVDVAVLVARESDVPAAGWASRALFDRLATDGVRLFEWPEGMMHSKTAVIDEMWSIVGSYNLDGRSLWHNLEVVVEIVDAEFAPRLRRQTIDDLARSEALDLAAHRRRRLSTRLLEQAAYALRYWL